MATKTATPNTKTVARKTGTNRANPAKRPATRRVQSSPSVAERVLRENLHWLFLSGAAILVGMLLFIGYRKITASSMFEVKRIDVAAHSSSAKLIDQTAIEQVVRKTVAPSGVWNADLSLVQKEVEEIAWIKKAIVSRVLPDGLRIRVMTREPIAVVRLASGENVWVDDEARVLSAVSENNDLPVLQGWNEGKDNEAIKRNQDRVRLYRRLLDEWRKIEVANRIAAINLADLQDVEVLVKQDDLLINVSIGNQSFGERLKTALVELEAIAQSGNLADVEKIINYDGHPVIRLKNVEASSKRETVANLKEKPRGKMIR